jgi:hypothetical protein
MRLGGGVVFLPEVLSVYRKHHEQMVGNQIFDGLCDVLELWQQPEYSHWPASGIAGLVLTELRRTMFGKRNWIKILDEIYRRRLSIRILRGVPRAVLVKTRRTIGMSAQEDENYEVPRNVEAAFRAATALVNS